MVEHNYEVKVPILEEDFNGCSVEIYVGTKEEYIGALEELLALVGAKIAFTHPHIEGTEDDKDLTNALSLVSVMGAYVPKCLVSRIREGFWEIGECKTIPITSIGLDISVEITRLR